MKHNTYKPRTNVAALLALLLSFTTILANVGAAYAATLTTASVSLSDSRPSTTGVTYDFLASGVTLTPINCIKVVFSDTATGTTVPSSMTTTGATAVLSGNYAPTPASWTTDASTNGTVKYTVASAQTPGSASARTVSIPSITNGNTANTSYYMQFSTYANTNCSSSPVDAVTVQFIYTNGQSVTASVDPTLTFSVAGVTTGGTVNGATTTVTSTTTTLPFGTMTAGANQIAAQDLTVTTNAGNGYTVYTKYTGLLTSGTYTIANLSGATNASPIAFTSAGTEGFGYTTNDATLSGGTPARFTTAGPKWAAFTTSNAEVAFNTAAATSETTRVGIQTGVASSTKPGSYATTVIYTATPIY